MDITEALRARGIGNGKRLIGDAQPADVRAGKTFSNAQGNDKEGTMPVRSLVAQTITPGVNNIIKQAGLYDGDITIEGDTELVPANIRLGTSIFGVSGTLTGKKFATGSVTSSASTYIVTAADQNYNLAKVVVTGLSFRPTNVRLKFASNNFTLYHAADFHYNVVQISAVYTTPVRITSTPVITNSGFELWVGSTSTAYDWIAIE